MTTGRLCTRKDSVKGARGSSDSSSNSTRKASGWDVEAPVLWRRLWVSLRIACQQRFLRALFFHGAEQHGIEELHCTPCTATFRPQYRSRSAERRSLGSSSPTVHLVCTGLAQPSRDGLSRREERFERFLAGRPGSRTVSTVPSMGLRVSSSCSGSDSRPAKHFHED